MSFYCGWVADEDIVLLNFPIACYFLHECVGVITVLIRKGRWGLIKKLA